MGGHAAALAFDRLAHSGHAPRRVVLPTELVIRGSGEVPP
jgi:DNA-binding LacI/PurR family transcriptional regulator